MPSPVGVSSAVDALLIVAGRRAFDTYSIGYITGWADEDATAIRDTVERVLKTAHTVAAIIGSRD